MIRPWEVWWKEVANIDHMRTPKQLTHPIRGKIVTEITKVGGSVLDVGCATAVDYPLFKEAGVKYTGIDVIEKFVKRAKEHYPEADIRLGDAFNLQFADGSYDVVYCKDLLEHLPPEGYKTVVREMWRVARRMMMIAFYIPPADDKTVYQKSSGGFFVNHYYRGEILDFIRGLGGDLEIIKTIDGCSLYVVRKSE